VSEKLVDPSVLRALVVRAVEPVAPETANRVRLAEGSKPCSSFSSKGVVVTIPVTTTQVMKFLGVQDVSEFLAAAPNVKAFARAVCHLAAAHESAHVVDHLADPARPRESAFVESILNKVNDSWIDEVWVPKKYPEFVPALQVVNRTLGSGIRRDFLEKANPVLLKTRNGIILLTGIVLAARRMGGIYTSNGRGLTWEIPKKPPELKGLWEEIWEAIDGVVSLSKGATNPGWPPYELRLEAARRIASLADEPDAEDEEDEEEEPPSPLELLDSSGDGQGGGGQEQSSPQRRLGSSGDGQGGGGQEQSSPQRRLGSSGDGQGGDGQEQSSPQRRLGSSDDGQGGDEADGAHEHECQPFAPPRLPWAKSEDPSKVLARMVAAVAMSGRDFADFLEEEVGERRALTREFVRAFRRLELAQVEAARRNAVSEGRSVTTLVPSEVALALRGVEKRRVWEDRALPGTVERGLQVVLVMDISGSMDGAIALDESSLAALGFDKAALLVRKHHVARAFSKEIVAAARIVSSVRLTAICFDTRQDVFLPMPVPVNHKVERELKRFLSLPTRGGTWLTGALSQVRFDRQVRSRKIVLLLTDAEIVAADSEQSKSEVERIKNEGAVVVSLGFPGADHRLLSTLCDVHIDVEKEGLTRGFERVRRIFASASTPARR
jgi:Mg-chelatase subunit ChlD